jgi:hypothetical protein
MAVLSWLYFPRCTLKVALYGFPVKALNNGMSWFLQNNFFLAVLSCRSVMVSCPGCSIITIFHFPGCKVRTFLIKLSCHGFHITVSRFLTVLPMLFFPGCPVTVIILWLSWHRNLVMGCPLWMACLCCLALSVLP